MEISRRRFLEGAFKGAAGLALSHTLGTQNLEAAPQITPFPPPRFEEIRLPLSREMALLQENLASEIANYQGFTAISISDTKTGELVSVNGDKEKLTGCVANLLNALTAINELSESKQTFTKEEIEPHLISMVRNSNPHEGLEVYRQIGGGDIRAGVQKVNLQMEEWGMHESFIDHPPAYWNAAYSLNNQNNYIVPNELNSVLTKLANGRLYNNQEWNDYAKWVMSDNKPGLNFMIPGQIPAQEAEVVHKVGWFYGNPNTINDAGIVTANDGRFSYSIVAMYENLETNIDENSLFYGPGGFLSKLSKTVYDTFIIRYEKPNN